LIGHSGAFKFIDDEKIKFIEEGPSNALRMELQIHRGGCFKIIDDGTANALSMELQNHRGWNFKIIDDGTASS